MGIAARVHAATVTLAPVSDTTLFQTSPTNNLGAEPTLISGSTVSGLFNRALLKFDIVGAGIPANAIIESVALNITVTKTIAVDPSSFTLHRVLRDWGEGTGINPGLIVTSAGDKALGG